MMQNVKAIFHNPFVICVDRIEGKYAVCELPDETMCDIDKDLFPSNMKEKERYKVRINNSGNIEVLEKVDSTIPESARHKLPPRFIRF